MHDDRVKKLCQVHVGSSVGTFIKNKLDGEVDGREVQKGGDISIPMADSC